MLVTLSWLASACSYPDNASSADGAQGGIQASLGSTLRASITHGKTSNETFELYKALTPTQKAAVWSDKMEHSKGFFSGTDQIAFIDFVMASINAEMIIEPVEDELAMMNAALDHFEATDVSKIFTYLHDYDNTPDPRRPNAGGGSTPDCVCNWSISCGQGTCESRGCKATIDGGCGILWLSNCVGICDNFAL